MWASHGHGGRGSQRTPLCGVAAPDCPFGASGPQSGMSVFFQTPLLRHNHTAQGRVFSVFTGVRDISSGGAVDAAVDAATIATPAPQVLLCSVLADFPVLGISQKWNPTSCGLSCLLLSLSAVLGLSTMPPVSHRGTHSSLSGLFPASGHCECPRCVWPRAFSLGQRREGSCWGRGDSCVAD